MGFFLRIISGPGSGEEFYFEDEQIIAGRAANNQLFLDDHGISRQHFAIEDRGGQYEIRDLQSANGILVNDRRVTNALLAPGDRIALGRITIEFNSDELDEGLPPEINADEVEALDAPPAGGAAEAT